MQQIIFIKLGGSVLTDKSKEKIANLAITDQLSQEISDAYQKASSLFVVGHGAGSFGHPQAKQYKTIEGNVRENSQIGVAVVRKAVTELNDLVISSLIEHRLPAVTLSPNSFIVSTDKNLDVIFTDPFFLLLQHRLIPVIHGDVIADSSIGWTIFSGEKILNALAAKSLDNAFNPTLIIEVGKTDGVYGEDGQTIPVIDKSNFNNIEPMLKGSEHTDVTGGMLHKVQEALGMAKLGIPTLLISTQKGNLKKALLGEKVTGTLIK